MHDQTSPAPQLLSLSEFREQLQISETETFRRLKAGQIPAVRLGGRTMVRVDGEPLPPPQLLSLRETRERLKISRTKVFRLIKAGHLPVVVVGGRSLVRESDLVAFIQQLEPVRPRASAARPA